LVRSYQITSVFQNLSALDNAALALQASTGNSWQFWRPARRELARYEQAAQLLERVGLGAVGDRAASALSHGEQRQLEVGLALALQPRLLLLDEPMAGMGPQESERMVSLLQALRGHTSLLLVEHDMDAVFRLADRISVLVNGRIIASGPPADIAANADVQRAYLGEDTEGASKP
jgi:branched-chain amino acid transport system ATP-binding protein